MAVAFSPDGRRLASGSYGGEKPGRIWADKQGRFEQVQDLKDHGIIAYSVAFSPDGRRLASASFANNTILIWADKQGMFEQVQELRGASGEVGVIAFSPDGR